MLALKALARKSPQDLYSLAEETHSSPLSLYGSMHAIRHLELFYSIKHPTGWHRKPDQWYITSLGIALMNGDARLLHSKPGGTFVFVETSFPTTNDTVGNYWPTTL